MHTTARTPVGDQRSIRFYTETLGFKLDWGGQPGSLICSVSKDGCSIMLSQLSSGSSGVWVWIGWRMTHCFTCIEAEESKSDKGQRTIRGRMR